VVAVTASGAKERVVKTHGGGSDPSN